jgi:hypothetical protein
VIGSIAWGNGTNFANFGAGAQVVQSNGGFAGSNGNLDVDPRFVDLAAGDLHLDAVSPCLGAANFGFALAAQKDHDENSRILDHALTGWPAPDMGAFEPVWDMPVTGEVRPGSVVTLASTGPPGLSFWRFGMLDGSAPVSPYGILLAGLPGPSIALLLPFPVPVGTALPLPLANSPALVGAVAGIQTLTFPVGNAAVGNFTRLYRALVRP